MTVAPTINFAALSLWKGCVDWMKNRTWTRIDKYAVESPPWRISKQFVDGCTLYGIWYRDEKPAKAYLNDFDECKDWIRDYETDSE